MQEQYNTRQLLSLGAVIALTPALRLFPTQAASIAGRAGWLAPLAALPLALVWARAMALLLDILQPGVKLGVLEITELIDGEYMSAFEEP